MGDLSLSILQHTDEAIARFGVAAISEAEGVKAGILKQAAADRGSPIPSPLLGAAFRENG